jgi:hypothetical protein
MKTVITDVIARKDANSVMVDMRKRTTTIAFSRMHIINDGDIGKIYVPLKLEQISLVYLIDGEYAPYSELVKVPATKEFKCRLLAYGGERGKVVKTSDITMHNELTITESENDVALFYLKPGKKLDIDIYARRGYSSEHVRWSTLLFGSVVTLDTYTEQDKRSPCYDNECDLEFHLVSKGNVNMFELFEYIKQGSDEDSTLSTFIKAFERSPIIPILYKMIDDYDMIIDEVKEVNTRDIGVEALDNHEIYIGNVLYRLGASIEFTLYMAGRQPNIRIKPDQETYDRFINIVTNNKMSGPKTMRKKEFNILNKDLNPPADLFVWNFLSTISSAIMLNNMYDVGKGADVESLEAYYVSLFDTFRYATEGIRPLGGVRHDLVDYYSRYEGMRMLDYTTGLYAARTEVIKLMKTFNLYGLDMTGEVLAYTDLQHINFMFFLGIAITRV